MPIARPPCERPCCDVRAAGRWLGSASTARHGSVLISTGTTAAQNWLLSSPGANITGKRVDRELSRYQFMWVLAQGSTGSVFPSLQVLSVHCSRLLHTAVDSCNSQITHCKQQTRDDEACTHRTPQIATRACCLSVSQAAAERPWQDDQRLQQQKQKRSLSRSLNISPVQRTRSSSPEKVPQSMNRTAKTRRPVTASALRGSRPLAGGVDAGGNSDLEIQLRRSQVRTCNGRVNGWMWCAFVRVLACTCACALVCAATEGPGRET